jgi:hypothetical protein
MQVLRVILPLFLLFLLNINIIAQPERWQQRVRYEMDIDFDVNTHRFIGEQRLEFFNNSPDTLDRVFYHLYLNAFQPGSAMDVRNIMLPDADPRVADRISKLKPNEIGYQKVQSLTQDGRPVKFHTEETILEVDLASPLLPGQSTLLVMNFEAQVPLQIRRNGRNSSEGVAYSMAQWYPKLCNYDYQGWHPNPYVGREFYGIWGDFDVRITIDHRFILGGTGYLQNAQEIGYGYEDPRLPLNRPDSDKLTWHFVAPDVHDFMWAADPEYTHDVFQRADGVTLHFLYKKSSKTEDNWSRLPAVMDKALDYANKYYGPYPYKQYSFIQGGDGGMEYPMATLITGERNFPSLVGVSVHELMHSWYQMVLGFNEALYHWMDEGFTSYTSSEIMNYLRREGLLPGVALENPHTGSYTGYFNLVRSGIEEPMGTHADHFETNYGYGLAAYSKGAVFLHQIRYLVGEENFAKGMLRFYDTWKFKHPNDNDFIRIMEKQSGLELDWFREYWVYTTKTIDYGIDEVVEERDGKSTIVQLKRVNPMPMPQEVLVRLTNGEELWYYIPLAIQRGAKPADPGQDKRMVLPAWSWTHPTYQFNIPHSVKKIQSIELDPRRRVADVNRDNDVFRNDEEKPKKKK